MRGRALESSASVMGVDAPEWEGEDLRQDLMFVRAGLQVDGSSQETVGQQWVRFARQSSFVAELRTSGGSRADMVRAVSG
ncbi:hypothetical protein PAXRUDRAFT_585185 [Paxillus rubicundulus Ve08.2h10]|uniref:Uncharacterized protein n=1 Tax=Paxillus rubicundulus Ve08.2h10 TaxID=930991 RepID=A0A0D0D663_9AGAM|nr:hypothetical protein PAXRUDRAFT_585185 [Paxillus rubicundulus Ve08.2h10]